MTISGTNFGGVASVHFGTQEARITSHDEATITVESPAGKGSVYVTVTTPSGSSPSLGKAAEKAKFKYKKSKK